MRSPVIHRRRVLPTLALLVLACSFLPHEAGAEIIITAGSLDLRTGATSSGALVLEGEGGFTADLWLYEIPMPGVERCSVPECGPGDRISLSGSEGGLDVFGTVTLDAVTYRVGTQTGEVMTVAFGASVTLPPLADAATIVTPFGFSGHFYGPGGGQLTGSGVATVTLTQLYQGHWTITHILYQFGSRLPSPWVSSDIGAVGIPGSASAVGNFFSLHGDGADIWGTADAFRFTCQPISGAGVVTAVVRVGDMEAHALGPQQFAKAGVMIRGTAAPSAASVILDVKPDGGLEFMARFAPGEATTFVAGAAIERGADVWLRLARSGDDRITASYSGDSIAWTTLGTVSVLFESDGALAGVAVTSHADNALYWALFEHVSVRAETPLQNLLAHGDFEGYNPPALGPPGWTSDHFFRQVPAKSEYHQPRSGAKNGACWTTTYLDCGLYQEVAAPATGTYTLRIYASADRAGGLAGANVNGWAAASTNVEVRPFGVYGEYVMAFSASAGDVIRVWMYSPAWPGYVVIDDASLEGVP
jgi:hypothetical protein